MMNYKVIKDKTLGIVHKVEIFYSAFLLLHNELPCTWHLNRLNEVFVLWDLLGCLLYFRKHIP